MYSYDGISWSDSVGGNAFSTSGYLELLTGPVGTELAMWVAVGNDSGNGNIMYSYDGISWSDSVGGTAFSNRGNFVLLTGPAGTELRCGWLLEMTVLIMETSCTVMME